MNTLRSVILSAVLFIGVAAFAYPSLLGPTGGANLPTARVAKPGELICAVDGISNGNSVYEGGSYWTWYGWVTESVSVTTSKTYDYRFLYGMRNNMEIGGTYNSQNSYTKINDNGSIYNSKTSLNNWGLNFKQVSSNDFLDFRAGWGVVYQNYSSGGNVEQLYGVLSNAWRTEKGTAYQVSYGLNWTALDNVANFNGSSSQTNATRLYIDMEVAFANKINLSGEYQFQGDIDQTALESFVMRYPYSTHWCCQLGWTNAYRGVLGNKSQTISLGLAYKNTPW